MHPYKSFKSDGCSSLLLSCQIIAVWASKIVHSRPHYCMKSICVESTRVVTTHIRTIDHGARNLSISLILSNIDSTHTHKRRHNDYCINFPYIILNMCSASISFFGCCCHRHTIHCHCHCHFFLILIWRVCFCVLWLLPSCFKFEVNWAKIVGNLICVRVYQIIKCIWSEQQDELAWCWVFLVP